MKKAIAFLKEEHNLSDSEAVEIVSEVVRKFGNKNIKKNCKNVLAIMLTFY